MIKNNKFWNNKIVLVTGGNGFIGRNLIIELKKYKLRKIISPSKKEFNLSIESDVKKLFYSIKPDIVIHLAAKVGGIKTNKLLKGEFFYKNIMIGTLVMEYARLNNVKRFVTLAPGCGYSYKNQKKLNEKDYWKDLPDENSLGYSMAKKMLVIQSWTYREQYGFNSSIMIPANTYGPFDNFNSETSHVIPALIKKFIEAKKNNKKKITIWGSGLASREFLYVKDVVKALIKVTEKFNSSGPINFGSGKEISIKELAKRIKKLTLYEGKIDWDKSKPDGQLKKIYNMNLFNTKIGTIKNTSLDEGLKKTISWYKKNI
tara:strand:- start:185 stop:1132 length:948 start_codon:yes stop_codon:yes gene_type:complete